MEDEAGAAVLPVSADRGAVGIEGGISVIETAPLHTRVSGLLQQFAQDRREQRRGLSGRTRQSIASMKRTVRSTRNDTRLYLLALRRERNAIRAELADLFAEYARARREERTLGRKAAAEDLVSYAALRQQDMRRLQESLAAVRRALEEENRDLLEKYTRERRAYAQIFRSEMDAYRQELTEERAAKLRLKGTAAAFEGDTPEHSLAEEDLSEDSDIDDLKMQVLEVIGNSPNGISLTGIGSCMLVEWRKLIRPAKELLEEGLIRKDNLEYFPAEAEAGTQAEKEPETTVENEDRTVDQQFTL